MTKDVMVYIAGTQFNELNPQDEAIELVTRGTYYKKNNKHYVLYDELIEGVNGITKNTIKFDDDMFLLSRSGAINTSMLFEENKRNVTNYKTPFGNIVIGLDASNIDINENDDEIKVNVDYSIDANYEFLADCKIALKIKQANK